MTDWSISAQQWGQFLCQLFDLWWERDSGHALWQQPVARLTPAVAIPPAQPLPSILPQTGPHAQRDRQGTIINHFHSWASQFAGGSALMCICSPICGRAVSMEKDGSLYSCDHYVYPEYKLGVADGTPGQSLSTLVRSQRQKLFGEAKSRSLPAYCKHCPFLNVCYGECPKRRFLLTPEGDPGLNYLCPGLRLFYDHAGPRLVQYGRHLFHPTGTPSA